MEASAGFSHIHSPDGLSNTLPFSRLLPWNGFSRLGMKGRMYIPRREKGIRSFPYLAPALWSAGGHTLSMTFSNYDAKFCSPCKIPSNYNTLFHGPSYPKPVKQTQESWTLRGSSVNREASSTWTWLELIRANVRVFLTSNWDRVKSPHTTVLSECRHCQV